MINATIELHNIAELDTLSNYPGPLVRRIPKAVAEALENGTMAAGDASLCEIRFVAESGRRLAFVLTAVSGGDLFIYRGDFQQNHVRLPANGVYRHVLEFDNDCFAGMSPEAFAGNAFSRHVWRIVFDGVVLFHGFDVMDCVIRAPRPEEKPRLRWLAYGSSITQGFTPVTRQQCYVAQAARRLGVDVLNLGLAGACFCENGFADYLTGRDDWDFITCELGVNMRQTFPPEEFDRRARYLIKALASRQPARPVVVISPFTSNADFPIEDDPAAERTSAFRESLGTITREYGNRNVHLIDGTDLLDSFAGLTCDLVHPSTDGHTRIAQNLATRLKEILDLPL